MAQEIDLAAMTFYLESETNTAFGSIRKSRFAVTPSLCGLVIGRTIASNRLRHEPSSGVSRRKAYWKCNDPGEHDP